MPVPATRVSAENCGFHSIACEPASSIYLYVIVGDNVPDAVVVVVELIVLISLIISDNHAAYVLSFFFLAIGVYSPLMNFTSSLSISKEIN